MIEAKEKHVIASKAKIEFNKNFGIDLRTTFLPSFKFEIKDGKYPFSFKRWDENGKPLAGYIDGVVCGKLYRNLRIGVEPYNAPPLTSVITLMDGESLGDVVKIHFSETEPWKIKIGAMTVSDCELLWDIYLEDNILVIECRPEVNPSGS